MKYLIALSFLILFTGSAGFTQKKEPVIDPIDIANNNAKMEGNRLKADDAKKNQDIASLLSARKK